MALTYEEFKKMVPKDTYDLFCRSLPDLDHYYDSIGLEVAKHFYQFYHEKILLCVLYNLYQMPKYQSFLSSGNFPCNGFNPNFHNTCLIEESLEEYYNRFCFLIPEYKDKLDYYLLTPYALIENILKSYEEFFLNDTLFASSSALMHMSYNSFRRKVSAAKEAQRKELLNEIAAENYQMLPISIISYLEVASKYRTILKDSRLSDIVATDNDINSLSLLMAIYYCHNNNNSKKEDEEFGEFQVIEYYLRQKGITYEKIEDLIGTDISFEKVTKQEANPIAIREEYLKYCNATNANANNFAKNSVVSVFEKIFDRSFTGSIAIEKILDKLNCDVASFKDISQNIETIKKEQANSLKLETYNAYMASFNPLLKDFVSLVGKSYNALNKKISELSNPPKKLNDDDIVLLALYIASYYNDYDIGKMFDKHGVTLDAIYKKIGITLMKEEIDNEDLDTDIIINKYSKFITGGKNVNRDHSELVFEFVCENMYDRQLCNSNILYDLYNDLNNVGASIKKSESLKKIVANFISKTSQELKEKENKRKNELTQKLFHDMNLDVVKIIEQASSAYYSLSTGLVGYDKKDLVLLSLFVSVIYNSEELKNFFSLGNFFRGLNLVPAATAFTSNIDIDLINDEYVDAIFGGENKDRPRESFTPLDLIRNIFSKKYNDSVNLNKLFKSFYVDLNEFADIEQVYENYRAQVRQKELELQGRFIVRERNDEECLNDIFIIHRELEQLVKNKACNTNLLKDTSDIVAASILLHYVQFGDTNYYLLKNNFRTLDVLKILGLPSSFFNDLGKDVDSSLACSTYHQLINTCRKEYSNLSPKKYLTLLFDPALNNSSLIQNMCSELGSNYHILEREVVNEKDYEDTLSIDEKINMLKEEKIAEPMLDDMATVLDFGISLLKHSSYIHSEIPRLIEEDHNDETIKEVSDIVDEYYPPVEEDNTKPRRLFFKQVTQDKPQFPTSIFLSNLEAAIDSSIDSLKKELLDYDKIRSYIEEYTSKNRQYYHIAEDFIAKLNERVESIDSEDADSYPELLKASSMLNIVNDKANRFAISNLFMRKELLRVNQAIVSHFVTINSLEMARDDLIPLIKTEMVINEGLKTEKDAIELSKRVMSLFTSLLSRNIDEVVENMHYLESTNVPEDVITAINNDLNTYIQGITQIKRIESKLEENDQDQAKTKESIKEKIKKNN